MDKLLLKTYEVAVANHPFLVKEAIACAEVLIETKSWDAVTEAVQQDNLLKTRSKSTATSYLRAVRFRLDQVPQVLLKMLTRDENTARFTLFYILLHKNRLLRECMEEIIRDNVLGKETEITRQELEEFFEGKRQGTPALQEWSDTTWRKFWQNSLKSIIETGILTGQDPFQITRPDVPIPLKRQLIVSGDEIYLHLMLADD